MTLRQPSPAVARIEALRMANGMTKQAFARKIGVSPTFLSDVTSGRRPLGLNLATRAGRAFGVSPVWIMYGKGQVPAASETADRKVLGRMYDILAPGDLSDPNEVPTLPVFQFPVDGEPSAWLHLAGGFRRSVSRDSWTATRYYLRVTGQIDVPPEVRPDDILLVETKTPPWKGISAPHLFVVEHEGHTMIRRLKATLSGRDRICASLLRSPPHGVRLSAETSKAVAARVEQEFRLLGVVIRLERDMGLPGAQRPS